MHPAILAESAGFLVETTVSQEEADKPPVKLTPGERCSCGFRHDKRAVTL